VNRRTVLDTIVCVTSDGPWNATLFEDRNCNGYMPQDQLIISAWGDLVPFYWNSGVQNHPPEILLVSCRGIGIFRFPCNVNTLCDCSSSPCAPELPCDCGAQWWERRQSRNPDFATPSLSTISSTVAWEAGS
jgi:hypothetical protein